MRKKAIVIFTFIIIILIFAVITVMLIYYESNKINQQIKTEIEQKSGRKIETSPRLSHMYYQALRVGDSKDFVHQIIPSLSLLRSGPIMIKGRDYEFEDYKFDEDFTYHIIIIYDDQNRIYSIELT